MRLKILWVIVIIAASRQLVLGRAVDQRAYVVFGKLVVQIDVESGRIIQRFPIPDEMAHANYAALSQTHDSIVLMGDGAGSDENTMRISVPALHIVKETRERLTATKKEFNRHREDVSDLTLDLKRRPATPNKEGPSEKVFDCFQRSSSRSLGVVRFPAAPPDCPYEQDLIGASLSPDMHRILVLAGGGFHSQSRLYGIDVVSNAQIFCIPLLESFDDVPISLFVP